MANFIPPGTISARGDYEIYTRFSREHILVLKGNFDGNTVTMTAYDDADGDSPTVDGGTFTAPAELRFVAPSGKIGLNVAGGGPTPSFTVNLTPIFTR